jgi:protoporphyrinogen oxidase
MPAKKGTKYLNAKTSSILSQYTPEQIQELLNSGEFKYNIAKKLGIFPRAFNAYIKKHNLTYKQPPLIKYGKQYKSKKKRMELIVSLPDPKADEEALERFRKEFAERKQKRMIKELNNGVYN